MVSGYRGWTVIHIPFKLPYRYLLKNIQRDTLICVGGGFLLGQVVCGIVSWVIF